tara:strand:+ start:546 stop:677 length:132 start_codon:yes stop_codon:yes gene_type:complete
MIVIDKIAQERFGEFGFSTCTEEQQQIILKELLNSVTIKKDKL